MEEFSREPTEDGKGVTIPSQTRCVGHFAKIAAGKMRIRASAYQTTSIKMCTRSGGATHTLTSTAKCGRMGPRSFSSSIVGVTRSSTSTGALWWNSRRI